LALDLAMQGPLVGFHSQEEVGPPTTPSSDA
jgi:hypothetical protein